MIEKLLIGLFNLLPKRLDSRALFCKYVGFPVIVYKQLKERILSKLFKTHENKRFSKYYKETKKWFKPEESISNYTHAEICIRYSGGSDSTYVAAVMTKRFKKVHLLTLNNSYSVGVIGLPKNTPFLVMENVVNLKKKFGDDKFHHSFADFKDLRDEIYFNDYLPRVKDNNYKKVLFCPSCQLAMHIKTIIYCLKNKIKYVSDGATIAYGIDVLQTQNPYALMEMKDFYELFGIEYLINPNYFVLNSDVELFKMGITSVENVKKTHRTRETQQYCLIAKFLSLCRRLHGADTIKIARSFEDAGILSTYFTDSFEKYKKYILGEAVK